MTSTFLVIGASTGLGRATAAALARSHRVITVGRHAGADITVDLRDLGAIARAAAEARAHGPFAGIACNAGLQDAGAPSFTAAGIEQTFAVNVLGHVAFLAHLAPAKTTRIGFVGSGTLDPENRSARRFGFRGGRYTDPAAIASGALDPAVSAAQNARDRYATSKLCDLLIVRALARRGVHAFAIDPGLMPGTGLARDHGALGRFAWNTILRVAALAMPGASTATRSGRAYAWALAHAERGAYVDFRRRTVEMPALARRDDHAEQLYAHCLALASVADPFWPQNRRVRDDHAGCACRAAARSDTGRLAMYQPSHFVEDDPEVLAQLIRAAPLATLIRGGAELCADVVPLELERDHAGVRLLGHVARANPLWREADGQPVLAVFHGANAYVSPGWYASKAEHGRVVPTWNYSLVQAHGTLRAIDDLAWLEALVTRLTERHEAGRPAPWAVSDAPADFIRKTLKAVIGIEIAVSRLAGKRKLSQNRSDDDRAGVIAGLADHPVAQDMRDAWPRR